jgi:hypothetical protein
MYVLYVPTYNPHCRIASGNTHTHTHPRGDGPGIVDSKSKCAAKHGGVYAIIRMENLRGMLFFTTPCSDNLSENLEKEKVEDILSWIRHYLSPSRAENLNIWGPP